MLGLFLFSISAIPSRPPRVARNTSSQTLVSLSQVATRPHRRDLHCIAHTECSQAAPALALLERETPGAKRASVYFPGATLRNSPSTSGGLFESDDRAKLRSIDRVRRDKFQTTNSTLRRTTMVRWVTLPHAVPNAPNTGSTRWRRPRFEIG